MSLIVEVPGERGFGVWFFLAYVKLGCCRNFGLGEKDICLFSYSQFMDKRNDILMLSGFSVRCGIMRIWVMCSQQT